MKKILHYVAMLLLLVILLPECKSKENKGINPLFFLLFLSRSNPASTSGNTVNVTGTINYEHVPVNTTTRTLNTSAIVNRPARGITINLVVNEATIVASTTTNSKGEYTFSNVSVSATTFSIIAVSEMVKTTSPTYNFKVVNTVTNGSIGTAYAISSSSQNTSSCTTSCTVNVTALDSNRGSGAFSILDVVYTAIQKILIADATTVFPQLNIKWTSTSTNGSFFTTSATTCGTGVPNCVVLLGNRSSDSDEFDLHVIAHEFTHYLESALSRSDSIGGSHSTNDTLEPRIAYGEGLGNAMGAIFLDNPVYTDTTAAGGFNLQMETPTHTNNGFFSEGSVQSVIWDLYDSVSDSKNAQNDTLNYSFAKIWAAVIALRNITNITYIHDFILALKTANPGDTAAINNILTMESIAASEGAEGNVATKASANTSNAHSCTGGTANYPYNPIVQALGTTGVVVNAVALAGSQNCGMTSVANNKLFGSKFYRMTAANSGTFSVVATDGGGNTEDPDVYITSQGVVTVTCNQGVSENCVTTAVAGRTYIVEIRTFSTCAVTGCTTGNTNSATITITLP
jgi:hypothetical protein